MQSLRGHFVCLIAAVLILAGSSAAVAQRPSFIQHDVTFQNGSVTLAGTVIVPSGEGPFPAIVYLHGSGPMTRAGFRPYAEAFAKLGVASLFYDKRGTGSSTGSWLTASLDDLARDALAAVHFLQSQDGIDPKRIGFWGISQGGWIGPRAAAQSGDVAFMILISGGGATPRESEMFSYRNEFDHAGLSKAEKTEGFDLVDEYFHYLATGENRPELVERLKERAANHDSKLYLLAQQLNRILPSLENQPNWSWVATYDPANDIAKLKCPVLIMFGDQDKEAPPELSVKKWREGLAKAGDDDTTIMVFPGAGHGIRMGRHSMNGKRPPFADGYREAMLGWLWLHVVTNSQS
jgi:pimeloyl-ACP methyl ester carboxylesterase